MELAHLKDIFDLAFQKKDFEKIDEIVSVLNQLRRDDKIIARSFYKEIGDKLFESASYIPAAYSYLEFENSIPISKKSKTSTATPDIDKDFIDFFNRHWQTLAELKDYYLFKLENGSTPSSTEVLILCCESSLNLPFLTRLKKEEKILPIHKESLSDYIKKIKGTSAPSSSYICILSITSNIKYDSLGIQIDDLFELFDYVSPLTVLKRSGEINRKDYNEGNKKEARKLIVQTTNKVFNNQDISYDAESLIKSFFKHSPTIINYKIIASGQSGSRVIEVQAVPLHMAITKRYVIKISSIDDLDQRKLKSEKENFDTYVKHAVTTNTSYSAEYDSNEIYEAILYNYASAGSLNDAHSFSKVLDAYLYKEILVVPTLVIDKLLKCEIFQDSWNVTVEVERECGNLYSSYLRNEDKIFNAIANINDKTIDIEKLKEIYDAIRHYKIPTHTKVCHGDLHSDNFFWDGKNVILIDFGATNNDHHSVIDHTFLETSIKLKHFPRYIPLVELLEYEKKFLSIDSFNEGFDMSFIKREDIRELYSLIHKIRVDSKKYVRFDKDPKEYFISLFLITIRQIQYYDLNQQLGLKISDLLAAYISKNVISKLSPS